MLKENFYIFQQIPDLQCFSKIQKKKVFTKQISTSAKKQNCSTKCNTEKRHQQIPENADKI